PTQPLRAAIDAALRGEEQTIEELPTSMAAPGETCYVRIICRPDPPDPANSQKSRVVILVTEVTADVAARRKWEAASDEIARQAAAMADAAAANREILAANEQLT